MHLSLLSSVESSNGVNDVSELREFHKRLKGKFFEQ